MNIRNKINRKIIFASLALFIFISFVVLFWDNKLNVVYSAATSVKYFIGHPINWIYRKVGNGFILIKNAPRLSQEIEDLQFKNAELTNQALNLNLLKKENMELRLQLGAPPINFFQPIFTARALGFDDFSTLVLGGGGADGLSEGMIVSVAGNVLVGKITKVVNHQSFTQTIFNQENKIPVKVMPSGSLGFLKADTFFNLKLEFQKNSSKISIGDTILTSGLDKTYPQNIIIGKISSIKFSEQELFNEASVEPAWNKDIEALFFIQSLRD
ncbi:MAG: Cell shape-determining protein MreC [Parcubacteria group bacterium GW2011_GWA2_39_18]|nr:MAG: Cell shape-determining protein MreC [Parcubacteria group bacterium GW2011_GWA2_39_18]